MDIRKLQRTIVDALEDVKAQQITVFNTEALSPLFERIVVASGTSNRQTKALAASVREAVKAAGVGAVRVEGEDNGEWIIVDCGAAVCHIMQPAIRDYYRLEEIWGGKPVRMKLGEAAGLPKAGASEPARPARKPPAKRAGAPAPAAKKTAPARKVASGKAAPRPAAPAKAGPKPPKPRTARTVQKVVVHSPKTAKAAAGAAAKKKAAR